MGIPTGNELLEEVWFQTIEELRQIALYSDDMKAKSQALQTLVQYFLGMGQSINSPFIPELLPQSLRSDDDEEDDEFLG